MQILYELCKNYTIYSWYEDCKGCKDRTKDMDFWGGLIGILMQEIHQFLRISKLMGISLHKINSLLDYFYTKVF